MLSRGCNVLRPCEICRNHGGETGSDKKAWEAETLT